MSLHVPTAGLFCVPAALEIITGLDPGSVIFPALNRRAGRQTLTGEVAGEHMSRARAALEEMGWRVREYCGDRPLGSQVQIWARRYPERVILIAAGGRSESHCMVLHRGRVHDSHHPMGVEAADHSYATAKVTWAAVVDRPEGA